MGKKKANVDKRGKTKSPVAPPPVGPSSIWNRRVPIAAGLTLLLTSVGLYLTYIYTGAEDLRVKVYEPLFEEVSKLEALAASDSIRMPALSAYDNLSRTGGLQRLPSDVQEQIAALYQHFNQLQRDTISVDGFLQRAMSKEIMAIRTESTDRAWNAAAAEHLRNWSNPDFSHCIPESGKAGWKAEWRPDFRV
jgi:hypothetical protein